MISIEKKTTGCLLAIAVCFLAFGVGYIHHQWFYPLEFHGDSAAMQVLAKAILDQGSLLPSDFSYGNQLVFLRSSPFIALASIFGLTGSSAFVIGSSLSIAFWGVILYFFLSAFFDSIWKGALFSTLLLLPLGNWDSDLVLGQQSHLSNAVLSLGLVVSACLYLPKQRKLFLVAATICLFAMSVEAPIRGLLVLGPLLISFLFIAGLGRTIITAIPMGLAFMFAYFLNKWLVHLRPISLNYFNTLSFKSTNEILENLEKTSRETFGSVSSINILAGERISLAGCLVLGAGFLLITIYLGFFLFGTIGVVKIAEARLDNPLRSDTSANKERESVRLVQLTSVLGLVVGALAVAALNPDSSRHYLWCIFLAKLFVFKWVFDCLSGFLREKKAAVILIGLIFLMSSWFAYLVKFNWNTARAIERRNFTEAVVRIKEISDRTGIRNIYGEDFWRMMPLNTFIPNINAQTLLQGGGEIRPFSWLTRPSWSCTKGDVLYYLKSGPVDEEIKKKLIGAGGNQVKSGIGYSLWRGGRVWRLTPISGCYESSLEYQASSFSNLPATVGVLNKNARRTDGTAGFLVFGPYSSLPSGEYELSVYGSSEFVKSAYVDVISNGGSSVHGRFNLEKFVKGPLLFKAVVHVTTNVTDLEVRIWVDKQDSLELVGYSLKPHSAK